MSNTGGFFAQFVDALARKFGTAAGTVCEGDDARLTDARTPTAHAATHVTGGGDTVADAAPAGNSGLMSGADKTKLDGIEALADVTDAANVAAAGAAMLTDAVVSAGTFNQADEPTVLQITAGRFGFWTDTGTGLCWLCYNHAGTVKTAALT